jgi:hypothetical protein
MQVLSSSCKSCQLELCHQLALCDDFPCEDESGIILQEKAQQRSEQVCSAGRASQNDASFREMRAHLLDGWRIR